MIKSKKVISIMLIILLVVGFITPSVYALTGSFNFTSNENSNIQGEDTFIYRNDCFKRSSFLGCSHLEALSAQVALASTSWYGENVDKYEIDYSQNSHNIVKMLNDMGFEDVSTNKYYTLEKEENSAGVAVGHRAITVDGKDYTLLAVIPRSAGYKQEWSGNFTVGDGDIHEGFKAARDEILRYVNKYIKDNSIQGNLKLWIAGHSRGAAISNMLGAFFAGGGIEYFGNKLSITPEDVYCYTFATPTTIKDGANKNTELSVAANRTDSKYVNDTPGEAFIYTKGGSVNVKSEIYGGIRNLVSSSDIFTMLPPSSWGFTHYGNDISSDHGKVTDEAMLEKLKEFSQYAFNKYNNGGNPNTFERKTFDLKTLKIVKDDGQYSAMDVNTLLKERLNGLTYKATTNKAYKDEDYQEILKAIAGTYGMSMTLFDKDFLKDDNSIIEPIIFTYLNYASERLQTEGKAGNETEAVTLLIEDLLSYFTGENINNENFIVDDFIVLFAKYISENENQPIADTVISGISSLIPKEYESILASFKPFAKKKGSEIEPTTEEGLKAFIKACYYGADPESEMAGNLEDASKVRETLYFMLCIAFNSDYPEMAQLFVDESFNMNGHGKFQDFVGILLDMFKTVKDDKKEIIKSYPSIAELADDKLKTAIDSTFTQILQKAENLYGNDYKNNLEKHIDTIKDNISIIREILPYALAYDGGKYNVENDIKTITTFIGNIDIIPLAHYNEIYSAYAKASKDYDCGYEDHKTKYICIEGENQNVDIKNNDKLSFKFNIDYDTFVKEGKVFIDNNETSRDNYVLSKGSTIVTFNDEYTRALSVGRHTINAVTDEGNVEVEFTVSKTDTDSGKGENSNSNENSQNDEENNKQNNTKSINPKTGDDIMTWISLAVISMIGLIVTIAKK